MLYKALVFCVLAMFGMVTGAWAQAAEKRVALVIGIGSYEHVPALRNPAGDAKAIGEALEGLKFQVFSLIDPDKRSVETTLRDFGDASSGADIAIIFYAGHAVQVDGHNYMIPKDARLEAVRDLSYDAVPLELFVRAVSGTKKAGVLIVDACRENPFVERLMAQAGSVKVAPGLSRIDDAPTGTLVAMSTRADHVAEDGAGAHSPYAQAILDELAVPGSELRLFFGKVSDRVRAATDNRQEPYVSHTLGGELVFLNPQPPNQPPVVAAGLTLEASDSSGAIMMGIPAPTDLDSSDRLMVEVTGLPKGGRTMIDDRPVHLGDLLNVEQLKIAAFDPDGTLTGDVGSFEFKVSDSRGGTSTGNVAITVSRGNNPPAVAASSKLTVQRYLLGIAPPTDSDGDRLVVTVLYVPEHGSVRNGAITLRRGDRLEASDLPNLSFDIGDAAAGPAGKFAYSVNDGHGGVRSSVVSIEIGDPELAKIESQPEAKLEEQAPTEPEVDKQPEPAPPPPEVKVDAQPEPPPPLASEPPKTEAPPVELAETRGGQTLKDQSQSNSPPASTDDNLDPIEGIFAAARDVNVRAGPSASTKRLKRLTKGSDVHVVGKVKNANWFAVELPNGQRGYVSSDFLEALGSEPAPEPAQQTETAPEASPTEQQQAEPPPAVKTTEEAAGGIVIGKPLEAGGFVDCSDCPAMVRIAGGQFKMGNEASSSERPVRSVTVRPFVLGQYEVTVGEWRRCVADNGCDAIAEANSADDEGPIYNVSWDDAVSYVTWLSKTAGKPYRLPTEAEWEFAAKAGTLTPYWWGSKPDPQYVSCRDCGSQVAKLVPPSERSLKPSPFGLFAMNGGVAEWVQDCWKATYEGAPSDGSARGGTCSQRVLRGGSWRDDHTRITAVSRGFYDHDVRYLNNGFRVARDADQ